MDNQETDNLDELEARLRSKLLKNASAGGLIKNWCKHPAYKMFQDELEEILQDKKHTWLRGTEEQARNARLEARGIQKALSVLKAFILDGELAKKKLVEMRDEEI